MPALKNHDCTSAGTRTQGRPSPAPCRRFEAGRHLSAGMRKPVGKMPRPAVSLPFGVEVARGFGWAARHIVSIGESRRLVDLPFPPLRRKATDQRAGHESGWCRCRPRRNACATGPSSTPLARRGFMHFGGPHTLLEPEGFSIGGACWGVGDSPAACAFRRCEAPHSPLSAEDCDQR
jgi:hypothetical protein